MKQGYLSDYFVGVATKILTRVDATPKSNQHEIGDRNGQLKKIFGDSPRRKNRNNRLLGRFLLLLDEQESVTGSGYLSWYDTRKGKAPRSPEWRLYYQSNDVTELMREGDRVFIAYQPDGDILFVVVPNESSMTSQLTWLFGLDLYLPDEGISSRNITSEDHNMLDFAARLILDEIGIEYEDPNANTLDSIIEKFGMTFPKTKVFSNHARLTIPDVDARDDPDVALVAWLDHEEAMFRRLERRIVEADIRKGWVKDGVVDIDSFLKYSLVVQNRRKSRMGRSFENHLKAVFDAHKIKYDAQAITEEKKKPDFIFPGIEQYHESSFDVNLLTMLAAKSTCKDRWTQILPEAKRLHTKHLITLELGISEWQTTAMMNAEVQLIVPHGRIWESYSKSQQSWLLSLKDFIDLVSKRQAC